MRKPRKYTREHAHKRKKESTLVKEDRLVVVIFFLVTASVITMLIRLFKILGLFSASIRFFFLLHFIYRTLVWN